MTRGSTEELLSLANVLDRSKAYALPPELVLSLITLTCVRYRMATRGDGGAEDERHPSVLEQEPAWDRAIDAARSEAVGLERYGRPAVWVSMERYEQFLDALEEAEDITAFDAAMAEAGDSIPWEQVKADLGWS